MSEILEFGVYRFDTEALVLWRDAEVVALPPKALELLRVLVTSRGEVVSKQQLMSRVWPDAVVEESNLSVTVALLRKALDPRVEGGSHVQTLSRRGYRLVVPVRGREQLTRPSLAVLPFLALGPEASEHLGLGLTDALIGRLAATADFAVRPTTAVVDYAGVSRPPRELAQELGVDAVVVGTVQREGRRLRVSLQLVPRPASMRVWADTFDANWTDLFSVQDELAERVVRAMAPEIRSSASLPKRPSRHEPTAEVYELYLRGRFFWARLDVTGVAKAFGCFGEAALADPAFAEPHASLSAAHILLGLAGLNDPLEAWRLADMCAGGALAQAPDLAEAHVSRAYVALFRDWDWTAARAGLDRACALAPGVPEWWLWRALFFTLAGDADEAERDLARARGCDPLSAFGSAVRTLSAILAGDGARALETALWAVDLRPGNFLSHWLLASAQLAAGRVEEACRSQGRAVELTSAGPVMKGVHAGMLAVAGHEGEARAQLEELTVAAPRLAYLRGRVHAVLGDTETALALLECAAEQREAWITYLDLDASWQSLREQPAFVAVRQRVRATASAAVRRSTT